jgi:methyl-accepting chemotaxis protein
VKTLASETARATQGIDQQVVEIRRALEDVIAAVGKINQTTGSVKEISTSIASAVEEQNAATGEINQSVQRAADHTRRVIEGISDLPEMAKGMQSVANSLAGLTTELGGQATMLDHEIERLLTELSDQRGDRRFASDADVQVTTGTSTITARLVDISEGGGRMALLPGITLGQTLDLRFPDGVEVKARVAWIANNQIGVTFKSNRLALEQVDALRRTDVSLAA